MMITPTTVNPKQGYFVESALSRIVEAVPQLENHLSYLGYNSGKLGLVVFYAYLAKFTGQKDYIQHAEDIFYQAVAKIDPTLYQGYGSIFYRELAEIGIAIHYLNTHELLSLESAELLEELDQLLYPFMRKKIAEGDLNSANGALAAGQYFLTRASAVPAVEGYLKELLMGIEKAALVDNHGNFYWKWPHFKSDGVYLGLSCGSAMILTFLAALYDLNIDRERIINLTKRASQFVMGHKRDFRNGYFPIIVGEKVTTRSLLFGDLGTSYGLLRAADVLQEESLREETLHILKESCQRRLPEDTLIYDANLWYGASGVGVLYDKMFRDTNVTAFEEAASYWQLAIPSYGNYNNEFAGFKAHYNQKHTHTNIAFNEGILGVGTVLMRYQCENLPPLDKLMGFL